MRHTAQPLRLAAHQYLSAPNSIGYYNKTASPRVWLLKIAYGIDKIGKKNIGCFQQDDR